jgi:hypothetical protein
MFKIYCMVEFYSGAGDNIAAAYMLRQRTGRRERTADAQK